MRLGFRRVIVLAGCFILCAFSSVSQAGDIAGGATPLECWKLIAASDAIVQGRTMVVESGAPPQEPRLTLRVDRWLKATGSGSGELSIVNRLGVPAQPGQEVTAFLIKPTEKSSYYLTADEAEAPCRPLEETSERSTADLVREIERQEQAASDFEGITLRVRQQPTHRKVMQNINALVKATEDSKASAFKRLLQGGAKTVPALIVLMDDARPLPRGLVELVSRETEAFESRSHHNPRTVFDAVVLVLGNLTGVSFGSEPAGGEGTRRRVVYAWRTYLAYNQPIASK